jgi:hypothetical protein
MSKDLASTTSKDLATNDMAAWGAPAVSSRDIVIPKILCMQGLSQLVVDDKAKMGDFVDSMTSEIIGNYAKQPVAFIPFHLEKIWIISTKKSGEGDFSFDSIVKVTPENEGYQYQEVIDGVEYKREYTMNFYVLRPEDTSLPYIISFKGMSSKAGKILATQMYVRNAAAGLIPPAKIMELAGTKDKNDKGTFITLNSKAIGDSSEEQIASAFQWYKTVNSGATKTHEEEAKHAPDNQKF